MTTDVVLLSRLVPDGAAIGRTLSAFTPELTVDTSIAAVVQVRSSGVLVFSIEAPSLVQVTGEAERLLDGLTPPALPYFWTEIRVHLPGMASRAIGRRVAESLASQLDGVLWPPG